MDRALQFASILAVVLLGIPPVVDVAAIGQPTQRALAFAILILAALAGVFAALRGGPLGMRATTAAYGTFTIGLGLFAANRTIAYLLAYVVALIGMNVLAYHARAFGPILAAVREEDAVSRRVRAVALRSLAVSGGVLAFAYGVSLAILPAFALGVGSTDPVFALLTAVALIVVLLALASLPASPLAYLDRVKARLR